ncbi:Uncharacterised protein [Vibrio cholerae]|nr:Uncharacterised protein [Vibrio cholerae]CSC14059.1 Uncharacterised protein [Vibrio cholerae]CSC63266.1 Uncharacterised protein [Vibrio cholerae]CSD00754.1 Uncharacterised protein [Vibrio cholerae]
MHILVGSSARILNSRIGNTVRSNRIVEVDIIRTDGATETNVLITRVQSEPFFTADH